MAIRSAAVAVAMGVLLGTFAMAAPQASADARSGVCAKGVRLESYSFTDPAYNASGEKMWSISWTKRWCYDPRSKRVVSAYSPGPNVKVYSYFDNAWRYDGITARDAYFTSVDARGGRHPRYPRWGHVHTWTVKMQHCSLKWTLCTNHYYEVGTIGYWDGSKKIV